jgi:predicted ATPase/DNA-binding NarL/FixJ family response regulator
MAMTAPTPKPAGLPVETTTFVGRRQEIEQTHRLLRESRLVTLSGPGGVGKTRLAVRAASGLADQFDNDIRFVDLAALTDPDAVPQTVAITLGVGGEAITSSTEVLADYLADRTLLLVLDSCDHLIEACANLVDALLRASPGLRVLATSRQPLGLVAEHTLVVPPLAVPEAPASLDPSRCGDYDAVALFVARANAVLPWFTLDSTNAVEVARLCAQLDGLPLAIELATVRLRSLSVSQLLDRLHQRYRLLNRGSPVAHPRQQTLRALVDWSYEHCTPAEQALWCRLSVFRGTFELESVEDVCADHTLPRDAIADLVMALVEKSVLSREEHHGIVRYRLLETIAAYGAERLGVDATEIRRQHRDHYLARAECAEREWQRAWEARWWDRIRFDQPNFHAALEFCTDNDGQQQSGLRLAAALTVSWRAFGLLSDGRRWLDRLLAEDSRPTDARAKALWANAWLATLQGDFERAELLLSECETLAGGIPDAGVLAHVHDIRGLGLLLRGDFTAAVPMLHTALTGYRARGDAVNAIVTLHRLAQAATALGDYPTARTLAEECLTECGTDSAWVAIYARWILGIATWRLGKATAAAELEREAIRMGDTYGDRLGVTLGAQVLAWIAAESGDAGYAARTLGAVDKIWRETGAVFADRAHLAAEQEKCRQRVSTLLGKAGFDAAFGNGRSLTERELIAEALTPHTRPVAGPTALTPREREIAEFVSRGLSNPDIARQLVISARTVETHVQHILNKLEFSSRAQIAVWVTEQKAGAGTQQVADAVPRR